MSQHRSLLRPESLRRNVLGYSGPSKLRPFCSARSIRYAAKFLIGIGSLTDTRPKFPCTASIMLQPWLQPFFPSRYGLDLDASKSASHYYCMSFMSARRHFGASNWVSNFLWSSCMVNRLLAYRHLPEHQTARTGPATCFAAQTNCTLLPGSFAQCIRCGSLQSRVLRIPTGGRGNRDGFSGHAMHTATDD